MDWWSLINIGLSGINLALILKIILNDLDEIRRMLWQHLRDHAQKPPGGVS